MQTKIRKSILALSFAVLALLASALPVAAQSSHSLRMENNTGYSIYEVRLSSVDDDTWHRDLLGNGVFSSGSSFTITGIASGRYDLLFVDSDGDGCEVSDVPIYQNRDFNLTLGWFVDNCE